MSQLKEQNLKNHARLDPLYHYFLYFVLVGNLAVCIVHAYHEPRLFNYWLIFFALSLFVVVFRLRAYPLRVQDRIIRLEEHLRLSALLPQPLRARLPELTESQLIALRFASDEEIPALVQKTLNENLSNKDIKKQIQNWRPDYFRV